MYKNMKKLIMLCVSVIPVAHKLNTMSLNEMGQFVLNEMQNVMLDNMRHAIENAQESLIRGHLENAPNIVFMRDRYQNLPLHYMALTSPESFTSGEYLNLFRQIIHNMQSPDGNYHVYVNAYNAEGLTPLHCLALQFAYAPHDSTREAIAELIQANARCDLPALYTVSNMSRCNQRILSLVRYVNMNPRTSDIRALTPIHLAALSNDPTCLATLLSGNGADINIQAKASSLRRAQQHARDDMIQEDSIEDVWETPVFIAVAHNNMRTVAYLLEQGADPNISLLYEGIAEVTPLWKAICDNNSDALELLLYYNASLCPADSHRTHIDSMDLADSNSLLERACIGNEEIRSHIIQTCLDYDLTHLDTDASLLDPDTEHRVAEKLMNEACEAPGTNTPDGRPFYHAIKTLINNGASVSCRCETDAVISDELDEEDLDIGNSSFKELPILLTTGNIYHVRLITKHGGYIPNVIQHIDPDGVPEKEQDIYENLTNIQNGDFLACVATNGTPSYAARYLKMALGQYGYVQHESNNQIDRLMEYLYPAETDEAYKAYLSVINHALRLHTYARQDVSSFIYTYGKEALSSMYIDHLVAHATDPATRVAGIIWYVHMHTSERASTYSRVHGHMHRLLDIHVRPYLHRPRYQTLYQHALDTIHEDRFSMNLASMFACTGNEQQADENAPFSDISIHTYDASSSDAYAPNNKSRRTR